MGRKKILDLQSHKFSLDISGENKRVLDSETNAFGLKYGPFINFMLSRFCRMSDDIKEVINIALINKCEELNKQLAVCGEGFEKQNIEQKKAECLDIFKIINNGKELDSNILSPIMRKIMIQDGYAILPKDWIILNEEDAIHCQYVGVVECRNFSKYGIPHFAFFLLEKYDAVYYDEICDLCCQKWEEFTEILKKQVDLIPDSERPGSYLNGEEYLQAPNIGIFPIKDSTEKESGQEFPYGAMVVRTNTDIEDN
ncbi:hypothetical protein DWV67_15370 [Dorea formicigenerans]|uniref:Uncharacterized protein n=1 Tax=Dorea formicigenerans TaxID=39486 RepID=A0A395XI18_9FIRM|nr:hypothetical protein DWV67_15370 [Dorea formicigenerans]